MTRETPHCKNVNEYIFRYGHDEDWEALTDDSFVPTSAPAGSSEKIEILRKRLEQGHPLWHQDDRTDYAGLRTVVRALESALEEPPPQVAESEGKPSQLQTDHGVPPNLSHFTLPPLPKNGDSSISKKKKVISANHLIKPDTKAQNRKNLPQTEESAAHSSEAVVTDESTFKACPPQTNSDSYNLGNNEPVTGTSIDRHYSPISTEDIKIAREVAERMKSLETLSPNNYVPIDPNNQKLFMLLGDRGYFDRLNEIVARQSSGVVTNRSERGTEDLSRKPLRSTQWHPDIY